ncbi:sugar transferase [Mycobacteroides abscessus subsp. abscessus]|nr:sugar transferase [Mycobacteroides abscessus subsp. abscessus]
MAVADGLADWFTHRDAGGLDPVRYLVYKRLDDLAYGTGLWVGAARARSLDALRPAFSRR